MHTQFRKFVFVSNTNCSVKENPGVGAARQGMAALKLPNGWFLSSSCPFGAGAKRLDNRVQRAYSIVVRTLPNWATKEHIAKCARALLKKLFFGHRVPCAT